MFKYTCKLVVFLMIFQMLPAPVAAQQSPAQAIAVSQAAVQKPQRDWPTFGKGFDWTVPGENPLIPTEMLPGFGKGDEAADRAAIEGVILELPGFEIPSRLFYSYLSLSIFDGKQADPFFIEDLKTLVKTGKFYRFKLPKSTIFRSRMGWGYQNRNGVHEVKLTGVPYINFDKEIHGYVFETIIPKTSLYRDLPLSLVIPEVCFNGVFQEGYDVLGDTQTNLLVPTKALTAKVSIIKDWRRVNGKKADAPKREDLQLRFEAVPVNGGETVPVEAFDNKKAEVELLVGKQYTIRELLDSSEWRATKDAITVQVGVKNDPVKFENVEVFERPDKDTNVFVEAIQGPPGRDGEDGRDGKGMPKWVKWAIPIIGGIAIAAFAFPKGGPVTNVGTDECKGSCSSSPGPRP